MKTRKRAFQSYTAVFLVCSAIIILAEGCATTQPNATQAKADPFKVPKATIRETTKTIAIFHLTNKDPIEGEFESLIRTNLREAGFVVIEPDRIAPIAAKQREEIGGFYDPENGKTEKVKLDTYWHNVLSELRTNLNVDAILFFRIVARNLDYHDKTSFSSLHWDGASQILFSNIGGRFLQLGVTYHGTVKALSLEVALKDMQRNTLFQNYGGIQFGEQPCTGIFLGEHKNQIIPRNELYTDPIRNMNAVNLALDPLTK